MTLSSDLLASDSKKIELPRDAQFNADAPVNWWYWNGHLTTEDPTTGNPDRLGYMMVIFAVGLPHIDAFVQIADLAITLDDERPSYHFRQELHLRDPHEIKNGYEFSIDHGNIIARGNGNGTATIHGQVDDLVLDLEVAAREEPVLHWGGDLKKFTFGGNTYYYSRENMSAKGTFQRDGKVSSVSGSSWFDRQWGELGSIRHEQYQWFGIQLDDGSEIILLHFEGDPTHRDSLASITRDGVTIPLCQDDYELSHERTWVSPHSHREYQMGWKLRLNQPEQIELSIEPVLEDQEFRGGTSAYWEGQCNVLGDRVGHSFVEMHGRLEYLSPENLGRLEELYRSSPTTDRVEPPTTEDRRRSK